MTELNELLRLTIGFDNTCTIDNPQNGCVTFAKTPLWLMKLKESDAHLCVLVDPTMADIELPEEMRKRVRLFPVEDVVTTFFRFHNEVNRNRRPKSDRFSKSCDIHPNAAVGVEGLRFIKVEGKLIRVKHIGNVVVGDDVEIGPFTVVYRGTIDSTILRDGVKIGAQCIVAHNAIIGENTSLTDMVDIGGSDVIGKDCFLGLGALIREGIRICDNVKIGMGAVVVKDINEPGIYAGVPARRFGDWDGGW